MCNIFYDWILHLLKKLKPWKCLKLLHWCETGWLDPLTKWSLFSILSSLQLKKRGTSSFQPALSLPLLLNVLFNERLVLPMPLTNRVANKAYHLESSQPGLNVPEHSAPCQASQYNPPTWSHCHELHVMALLCLLWLEWERKSRSWILNVPLFSCKKISWQWALLVETEWKRLAWEWRKKSSFSVNEQKHMKSRRWTWEQLWSNMSICNTF